MGQCEVFMAVGGRDVALPDRVHQLEQQVKKLEAHNAPTVPQREAPAPAISPDPWKIGIASALIGAVCAVGGEGVIASWQAGKSHDSDDSKRDIALEVSKQVDQKVNPILVDIGKIKGRFGVGGKSRPRKD